MVEVVRVAVAEGAERLPGDAPRVLYLVISGAPAPEGLASLVTLLQEDGWRVYVDWQDPAMSEKPTRETAERIKLTIRVMDYFLFLATPI